MFFFSLIIEVVVEIGGYRDFWYNGQFYMWESFNWFIINMYINFMFDFIKFKYCFYINNCFIINDVFLKILFDVFKV